MVDSMNRFSKGKIHTNPLCTRAALRHCVRCPAIRITRLAFIRATFVPRGAAEGPARVGRARCSLGLGVEKLTRTSLKGGSKREFLRDKFALFLRPFCLLKVQCRNGEELLARSHRGASYNKPCLGLHEGGGECDCGCRRRDR